MNRYFHLFVLIIIGVLFSFSGCKNNDVTGVTLSPDICVLRVGETIQLTATVSPNDADDKSVKWIVNTLWMIDPTTSQDVVTVSENGKLTGHTEGAASVVCITNSLFYEATSTVIVGYAAAVDGIYHGSLSNKNGTVIQNDAVMSIRYLSEDKALWKYFPSFKDSIYCNVDVDYAGEKMCFEGENNIDMQGVVKISGTVTLEGKGNFEIFIDDNTVTTYSFSGIKAPRQ